MRKPNIILIFTDNQMAETLGCYGNAEVYTPNLDRMAARGRRFSNAFCSPCRKRCSGLAMRRGSLASTTWATRRPRRPAGTTG
ncbi:sulfatase-like hydrolase/transferase [Candidatus Rhodobacter oscarellae]|uniref:sulfatase-like hydrolase/transferase n=1 Tax=Candidatus Rhodobacter oscarellae TaxID=1675527 RepID=UPI0019104822